MKKQAGTKLSLDRETLIPLQALDGVNGGNWTAIGRTIIQVSKYACTTVTTVQSHPVITCRP
jgi:hypothetical protein